VPGLVIPPERGEPGYLRLPVRVPGRAAGEVVTRECRRLGLIPAYPRALPTLEAVGRTAAVGQTDAVGQGGERAGEAEGSTRTPGADTLARELFTVPTHSMLGRADLARIADRLRSQVEPHGAAPGPAAGEGPAGER
jgi:hypothetical protein